MFLTNQFESLTYETAGWPSGLERSPRKRKVVVRIPAATDLNRKNRK